MEYEKIKELINWMGESALTSLDLEFQDGIKINMKKESKATIMTEVSKNEDIKVVNILEKESIKANEEGQIVTSPMVGTFYSKPAPNADAYVSIGENVQKGTVLCIIEAMKLMNEIESEYEGKIVEILVKDGESVEYGKPLFRII